MLEIVLECGNSLSILETVQWYWEWFCDAGNGSGMLATVKQYWKQFSDPGNGSVVLENIQRYLKQVEAGIGLMILLKIFLVSWNDFFFTQL